MRSLLFVPAIEKMLNKISDFSADAYIIDLEDSITEEKKDEALLITKEYLSTSKTETIFVRLDRQLIEEQLNSLDSYEFSGCMLPKFECPKEFGEIVRYFKNRTVIALVETPRGFVNLEKIVSCPWVNAIAFGAEDYTSSVGMQNRQDYLLPLRSRLVMYGKAFGKKVYDTPSFAMDDQNQLEMEIQVAQDLGFDGKMAINPKHVPIINRIFRTCDYEYISSIITKYEESGEAVLKIDGKVYEKMHINHFKRILKERNS